ncbi:TetR/AcrR family transcriptional regulator [Gordonia jinhuaensis]|uniref:Transcriptional regulator, TetR family protein n=1 Tax=Gordonia jinhuaensis TaxID=1517702 RepID=A0A916TK99_9ACTN|nr:TetR/AcrR family transcriptional regulator [Gordonia jinhuaensis]GGB48962.1 putative transcriptional regulator, TetR family protein [Gordonia jinhuaensis]
MARVDLAVRRAQLVVAAREVLSRDGVANTSLRAVAAEGDVPLGTLQYVFPTREALLGAVIEDVVSEIGAVFAASTHTGDGLAHALREGIRAFWQTLVSNRNLQIMQYELTMYALRAEGQEELARWQYESYADVVSQWCAQAAEAAGEVSAVPLPQLARIMVATIDGLIMQYVCDPDQRRAEHDLDLMIEMLVGLAAPRPASATA